jgi:thymidylate kinase
LKLINKICPKPLFIVIEGIDGSGKSTQIELLYKAFNNHGQSAITTHEPTDGKIGLMIRDIMSGKVSADPAVIAALYLAGQVRSYHTSRYRYAGYSGRRAQYYSEPLLFLYLCLSR